MLVTAYASRKFARIGWFVFVFALATGILYIVSYENRVSTPEDSISNSSTTPISASSSAFSKEIVADVAPPPANPAAAPTTPWKKTMTTLFWVGEGAGADNDYITNVESYWDERWQEHFGGVDSPDCRSGYFPCGFTPKENPFYFALPYAEYDEAGEIKESAKKIPWYRSSQSGAGENDAQTLLKNRWIAVRHGGATCYAQWQDVGPNGEDDFAYVFGSSAPTNTFGVRAGLDVSPALWKCLGMTDNAQTEWIFVDFLEVPEGPWKGIVTTSGISWGN
jgi:hypothetical protein